MTENHLLAHIQAVKPLVATLNRTDTECNQLENKMKGLEHGRLRSLYHYNYLNSLFALVIVVYFFVFHLIFGDMLVSTYHTLLFFDSFVLTFFLVFCLFLAVPLSLYFLLIYGINTLIKKTSTHQSKLQHIRSALAEATSYRKATKQELHELTDIPAYYLKPYSIEKFETYFKHQRADSLKEAINLFETEKSFLLHQYTLFRFHGEKRLYQSYEQAVRFEKQAL
ncbi:hypothetical protein JCM19046_2309 [Bacillus sp. JCM 19046]|nr:hypothetical protein JCM19045_1864 [Bacillus sp. JCM 19045]GAF17781.1 hypothetical protein JCM19046_2309 [Bacillus sp. JCM 19046]